MLIEHLIEPEALVRFASTRRNFSDFMREFSKPCPRVIGNFMKFNKFKSTALKAQSTDAGEMAKTRLDELIQFIAQRAKVDRRSACNHALGWRKNAQQIAEQCKVDYLLLDSAWELSDCKASFLYVDHFEQGIESLPCQILVPKSTDTMVAAVGNMLRLSSSITFVDPYFNGRAAMWDSMVAFIQCALEDAPNQQKHVQILFDHSASSARSADYLLEKFQQEQSALLNRLASFSIKSISEQDGGDDIHNRYIITDLAAVTWGVGLDARTALQMDDVSLLSERSYECRYEQYVELKGFELKEHAKIN